MPMLHGLIFDLDGTLVDSAADLRQAINTVLAAHGRRPVTIDEVKNMVGDGMRILLQRAFVVTGMPMAELAASTIMDDLLRAYEGQTASKERLYPYVIETLTQFRAQHVKIGLCTNKLYEPTLKLLSDIGITSLFDFVAGCDTFPVFKPHPGHVLGVAKGLQVLPQNCVMIGDSSNDIRAAQGAHVTAIAVSHGYGRDVGALGADAVIGGFQELPNALRRLGFDIQKSAE